MRYLRKNEILRVPIPWHAPEGGLWLVVFELAEIDARLQCVGMEIRSFVRFEEAQEGDESYPGYWGKDTVPPPSRFDQLSFYDPDAYATGEHLEQAMLTPQVLQAKTMRGFPFAAVLTAARKYLAEHAREFDVPRWIFFRVPEEGLGERDRLFQDSSASIMLGHERDANHVIDLFLPDGGVVADALKRWVEATELLQDGPSVEERRRPGRPSKYSRAKLETVAALYTEALHSGSPYPTAVVLRQLAEQDPAITRNIVAKLVMRCRKLGLLGPTEMRKAGGVVPVKPSESDAD